MDEAKRAGFRPIPKPLLRPRRVRGGLRLAEVSVAAPGAWLARRWLGILSPSAGGAKMAEGQSYASQGQTRSLEVLPGRVVASVQGRAERPYETSLAFATFSHEQWERCIEVLSGHPAHAARLFAGELPMAAEELLESCGLPLLPRGSEVVARCSCSDPDPVCKHAVCVWLLLGERLARDPFVAFTFRGLLEGDLLERLRARRAVSGGLRAAPPVYAQHIPGASDFTSPDLSATAFWTAPDLAAIDIAIEPPEVSHPLLRRLGASPFSGSRFPLIGLLATCYELTGQDAIHQRPVD